MTMRAAARRSVQPAVLMIRAALDPAVSIGGDLDFNRWAKIRRF